MPAAARRLAPTLAAGCRRPHAPQVELHLSEGGGPRTGAVKHVAHAADASFPAPCHVSAAAAAVGALWRRHARLWPLIGSLPSLGGGPQWRAGQRGSQGRGTRGTRENRPAALPPVLVDVAARNDAQVMSS